RAVLPRPRPVLGELAADAYGPDPPAPRHAPEPHPPVLAAVRQAGGLPLAAHGRLGLDADRRRADRFRRQAGAGRIRAEGIWATAGSGGARPGRRAGTGGLARGLPGGSGPHRSRLAARGERVPLVVPARL